LVRLQSPEILAPCCGPSALDVVALVAVKVRAGSHLNHAHDEVGWETPLRYHLGVVGRSIVEEG
jgi:hypothetical protein